MIEKQPQMLLAMQACLKAATSGPSSVHMMAGSVAMLRPCSEYSGNTTRSIVPWLRRALATMSQMRCVCAARSAGVATTGSVNCTRPTTTPCLDLFNPPRPDIACSLKLLRQRVEESSPGLPTTTLPGLQVSTRMTSVST